MKSALALLCLGAASVAQAADWVLTWSDDFDGDSVDKSKWNVDVANGGFGNNEL